MKKTILLLAITTMATILVSAQGIFRVSPGTELLVNNNVRIVFNNSSFENNGSLGIASQSRFVFTGNSAVVAISGTGNTVLGELELNKSAGVVQLNRPLSIFTSVIFTSGNFDLNGNTLFFLADPNGQLIGENTNSRIIGNTGRVRKPATLNAPSNLNPGNIGVFISSGQNPGATTIERLHYPVNGQNVRRVFHLTPTNNTALNATLQFQYLDAELSGLDENLLSVWRSDNGTSGWTNIGGVVNPALNTLILNGVNDFAWYTIAPGNAALPVTLSAFGASCNSDGVLIKWQTTQEENTDYFELQTSLSGTVWSAIAQINATGNSSITTNYQYKDLVSDRKFYRLRIVDKDGKFSYSGVRTVNCGTKKWDIAVYPNPARDKIALTINGVNRHSLAVKIVNAVGQLVWQQQVALTNQYRQLTIPVTQLAAGIYYIHVEDGEYKQTITISKQ
jgi:Secretion system C-terminal sorting domain